MSRSRPAVKSNVAPSYRDWKAEASKQLQYRHGIPAAAIPESQWTRLFIRHFSADEAADRAERHYRSTRPASWLTNK
jgi:hypothetical protein